MYNRRFFNSKLGQAAIASIAVMVMFVAVSSQMQATPAHAASLTHDNTLVEIA